MMRLIPFVPFVLIAVASLGVEAGQVRSISDRVYSDAQASRGQDIYKSQCAECHGNAMEGVSGPPLVGDDFLGNWSARPLTNLVDKIQKTMPFTSPGSLSRAQSIDLVAYILQTGKFPAGATELSDGSLAQVTFPTAAARTASTPAVNSTGTSLPPPEGNLAELMRAIAFPNANIIFNTQLKDPGAQQRL